MSAPAGNPYTMQKLTKYRRESLNVVEKMPSQFSFEVLGNQMRDSLLCKVYSSGVTLRFATSSWKYRRSKLALPGNCTLLYVMQMG